MTLPLKILAENGRVYVIKNPDLQLWTIDQLERLTTWPKLPLGVNNRLVDCDVQRLKSTVSAHCHIYLVWRISNGRLVSPNKHLLPTI